MIKKKFTLISILILIIAFVVLIWIFLVKQDKVVSTWVWNEVSSVDLQFARNNQVNELYIYLSKDLNFDKISSFIEDANKVGIAVYALQGEPEWTHKSEKILNWLSEIKEYNEETKFPFAGVVFDIEPYLLPEWDNGGSHLSRQFLSVVQEIEEMKNGFHIKWTIPFWFDTVYIQDGISLAEAIIQEVDEVVIMAYRNNINDTDGILDIIKEEMKWAKLYKTPLIVALETRKANIEKVSFYGSEKEYFELNVKRLQNLWKHEKYIRGISIHYLDTWKELIELQ